MKYLFGVSLLLFALTSCTNQPSESMVKESLTRNFEGHIEVIKFNYINSIPSEVEKVTYFKYYFDAMIKFKDDWTDNSPNYRGRAYHEGDQYQIRYANMDFILTEEGWRAMSLNIKDDSDGFVLVSKQGLSGATKTTNKPFSITTLKKIDVPSELQYNGKFLTGKSWIDKNGTNYVIISEVRKGEFGKTGFEGGIYACAYQKNEVDLDKSWEFYDKGHAQNLEADYISKSLNVSDLDNDGIFENSFMYIENGEHSGNEPYFLKQILHSGSKEYVVDGTYCPSFFECGKNQFHFGNEYENAPKSYKSFAQLNWSQMLNSLKNQRND